MLDFDDYRFDPQTGRLTNANAPVRLTAKAAALLGFLVSRAPEVVSRAEIEAAVWPDGFVEPANVTQTIYMLRRAMAREGRPAPIETVTGRGYRLSATVRGAPPPAPARANDAAGPAGRRELMRRIGVAASVAALIAIVLVLGITRHVPG